MIIFLLLLAPFVLFANPQHHFVESGQIQLSEEGALLSIEASDRSIIHWESFSIAQGETTRFVQPSIDAAVLNRVDGFSKSQIDGLLEANGHVYLINPNGVIIGSEGRVDTAGFIASTFEIHSEEFLSEGALSLSGEELGGIQNFGVIQTHRGSIALIGHRVENYGELHAERVTLIAGHEVLFDPTGDALLFVRPELRAEGIAQDGVIDALKVQLLADGAPFSAAIGMGGAIEADAIEFRDGEFYLSASSGSIHISPSARLDLPEESFLQIQAKEGSVEFRGTIHAPQTTVHLLGEEVHLLDEAKIDLSSLHGGAELLVGGDYQGKNPTIQNAKQVFVGPEVSCCLDAKEEGNGGKAIFWGDESCEFWGQASAQGGVDGGDGGFVEVSSPGEFAYRGKVSMLAPKGSAGTLLLDPSTIAVDLGATTASETGGDPNTFYGNGSLVIKTTDLEAALESANVIIDTSSGTGGNGDITLYYPLTWTSGNNLSLVSTSGGGIFITGPVNGGSITTSGSGGVNLVDATITLSGAFSATTLVLFMSGATLTAGSVDLTATTQLSMPNSTTTSDTSITLTTGGGTLSIYGATFNTPENFTLPNATNGVSSTITTTSPLMTTGSIATGSGSLTISSSGGIHFLGAVTSGAGSVTVDAGGEVSFSSASNVLGSALAVTTTGGITLNSGSSLSSSSTIALTASGAITLGNGIDISGSTTTLIAGTNISATGTSGTIETTGNTNLTLVADNLYPSSPNFGSGAISIPSGYTLQTNSGGGGAGQVLLFSSTPALSTLPSTINATSYQPGVLRSSGYTTGTNEFVGYWYLTQPAPATAAVFQVVFKDPGTIPMATQESIDVALTQPIDESEEITEINNGVYSAPAVPSPTTTCRTPTVSIQG